jgi:polar amino acid transport system substrate-binding protein
MHLPSKTPRRSAILLASALGITLALSACGADEDAAESPEGRTTLVVATSNDAPFSYTDAGGGDLKGIDGEMINAIAEEEGWEIEVFTTDFNTLISALKAEKADVIVDAMYMTDERKKEVAFTDSWYTEGEGMLVPAGSTVKTRDDVKGLVLGAQTGTAFADFAGTLGGSEVKLFDSQAAIIAATANGQVDAAFTDSAVLGWTLVENPNDDVEIVDPYEPFFPGTIGAAVRQEDTELLDQLNQGLADLKATPKYLEILQKYGLGEANVTE